MTVSAIPLIEYRRRQRSTADVIAVDTLARELGYEPDDVRGQSRFQEQVEGRRIIARAFRLAGWSYPRIGRALGGRDHTTIMALCGTLNRRGKAAP